MHLGSLYTFGESNPSHTLWELSRKTTDLVSRALSAQRCDPPSVFSNFGAQGATDQLTQEIDELARRLNGQDQNIVSLASRLEQLVDVFNIFDLDASGYIEAHELQQLGEARRSLGQKSGSWTAKRNAKLVNKLDKNGDQKIRASEFSQYFENTLPKDKALFDVAMIQFTDVAKACRKIAIEKIAIEKQRAADSHSVSKVSSLEKAKLAAAQAVAAEAFFEYTPADAKHVQLMQQKRLNKCWCRWVAFRFWRSRILSAGDMAYQFFDINLLMDGFRFLRRNTARVLQNSKLAVSRWQGAEFWRHFCKWRVWCDQKMSQSANEFTAAVWSEGSLAVMWWSAWRERYIKLASQKRLLLRSITCGFIRGLEMRGLRKWRSRTAQLLAERQLLKRVCHRFAGQRIADALRTWCEVYAYIEDAEECAGDALKQWTHKELGGAWRKWQAHVEEIHSMLHGACSLIRGPEKRVIRTWRLKGADQGTAARQEGVSLKHWLQQELLAALVKWRAVVHEIHQMKRTLLSLLSGLLARSLRHWREEALELKTVAVVAGGALVHWQNRELFAALARWRAAVHVIHQMKRAANGFVRVLEVRALRKLQEEALEMKTVGAVAA